MVIFGLAILAGGFALWLKKKRMQQRFQMEADQPRLRSERLKRESRTNILMFVIPLLLTLVLLVLTLRSESRTIEQILLGLATLTCGWLTLNMAAAVWDSRSTRQRRANSRDAVRSARSVGFADRARLYPDIRVLKRPASL